MRQWLPILTIAIILLVLAGAWLLLLRPGATSPLSGPPAGSTTAATWYQLYFTQPKYPDNPREHIGGPDEKLAAMMDRATHSLDVAIYDFDLETISGAMARAKGRGAKVRMVTDSDTINNIRDRRIQAALKSVRDAGIPIIEDQRGPIMHHKFTVADGQWVSTGSWNYTDGDTYRLNNWMGILDSRDLAAGYTVEFEQLFSGRFGTAKADAGARRSYTIDGVPVQVCFSPKGKCADLVAETIRREAKSTLQFMAFSFTHDGIGQAIIDRHQAGVSVVGVFEATGSQTQFSEYGRMKSAGLEVYTDGNPYAMHHKVVIIDGRIVLAGSFNFSSNADRDNDENLLIIEDAGVAAAFRAEFDRVLEQAKNPPARR